MTQVTYKLPFEDINYEAAAPKYNLKATRPLPLCLIVDGKKADIEKFEIDFVGIVRDE